jgi:hypothetical protein
MPWFSQYFDIKTLGFNSKFKVNLKNLHITEHRITTIGYKMTRNTYHMSIFFNFKQSIICTLVTDAQNSYLRKAGIGSKEWNNLENGRKWQ